MRFIDDINPFSVRGYSHDYAWNSVPSIDVVPRRYSDNFDNTQVIYDVTVGNYSYSPTWDFSRSVPLYNYYEFFRRIVLEVVERSVARHGTPIILDSVQVNQREDYFRITIYEIIFGTRRVNVPRFSIQVHISCYTTDDVVEQILSYADRHSVERQPRVEYYPAWSCTPMRHETAEEKEERLRREKEREKANEKAEELLLSFLTDQQREDYKEEKSFTAIGNKTGTRYKITKKRAININLEDNTQMCATPDKNIPLADHMLNQKLIIETNEEEFLKVAKTWDWNLVFIRE